MAAETALRRRDRAGRDLLRLPTWAPALADWGPSRCAVRLSSAAQRRPGRRGMPNRPSPSAPPAGTAVITCGALGGMVREIAARRGWVVQVHSLPALLHNRPAQIAPAARELARELLAGGLRVALAYADCGSYGALDQVCADLDLRRLPGLHCYDVLAGPDQIQA